MDCSCNNHSRSAATSQTIQELEFERGIWSAAVDGDEIKVKQLLLKGVSPNAMDTAGYAPLHYASRSNHLDICTLLLAAGAIVNLQTPGGATPLHRACYCGHLEVVRILLEYGADTHLVDSDGRTPLHKAAEGGHLGVAKTLVSFSEELKDMKDRKGLLPLDLLASPTDVRGWTSILMSDSLRSEIESANARFMTVFGQQDAAGLSELYTSDCKLMPSGCDVVEGKGGVANVFQGVMTAGAATVVLKVDEVGPLDANIGMAYERSHYTFYKKDGSVFNHGKYVVIWKKVEGKWLLHTDIFNSNT